VETARARGGTDGATALRVLTTAKSGLRLLIRHDSYPPGPHPGSRA